MTRTSEQLAEAATDPRLKAQPKWVQELVHDLTLRMIYATRRLADVESAAEREVGEARALLTGGPADSDTYVDLPRAVSVYEEYGAQRPLGKGACIEFRDPGDESGEGVTVRRTEGGSLLVRGSSTLVVVPQDTHTILIEER